MPVAGFALVCIAFGFLAIEHALSLPDGRTNFLVQLEGWLISDDYAAGPGSIYATMTPLYRAHIHGISLHMGLGGIALILGVGQFIPVLRRQYPRLHRVSGIAAVLAGAASMIGAAVFLGSIEMRQDYSGPSFHIGLWALAGLTFCVLLLAVHAIRIRDYRAHMGWMAAFFAALLTAPLLRLEWMAFGWLLPYAQDLNNLGSSITILPQALLLMALWMAGVGDQEFPAAARSSSQHVSEVWADLYILPAGLAALVILHESWLALWGFDLLGRLPGAPGLLPMTSVFWGLMSLAALRQAPGAMRRALAGGRISAGDFWIGAGCCLGMGLLAATSPPQPLSAAGMAFFWGASALIGITQLLLARFAPRGTPGRDAWAVQWLFSLLLPACWLLLAPLGFLVEIDGAELRGTVTTLGFGLLAMAGFATGFGLWPGAGFAGTRRTAGIGVRVSPDRP